MVTSPSPPPVPLHPITGQPERTVLSAGCHVEVGPIDDPTVYEVLKVTEAEARICIFIPSQRQLKRWATFAKEEQANFPAFRALMMRTVQVVHPEWCDAVNGRVVVREAVGSTQLTIPTVPKRHLLSWIFSMGGR